MKRSWLHLSILVTIFGIFSFFSSIQAAFSSVVTSPNNLLQLGTLDLSLTPTTLFTLTDFKPGDFQTKSLSIDNQGSLPFQYNFEFTKTAGSDALCQALELKAEINSSVLYQGSLSSFTLNSNQTLSSGSQDDWGLTISLNQSDESLQSLACDFDIAVSAYQTTSDGSWGFTDSQSTSSTIESGDWTAPTSQASSLSVYQNSTTFNVPFTADDSGGLVDTVDLYYRYGGAGSFTRYSTYDVSPDADPASGNISFTAVSGDGLYQFFTSAADDSGNTEDSTSKTTETETTLDTVDPSTSMTVSSGKQVNETVSNPGFEQGLTSWSTQGDVNLITSDSYEATAYDGTYMVRLGTPESFAGETSGNTVWTNKITQRLSPNAKNFSFHYNLYSFDTTGFDDPAVFVILNDYAVFKLTASEIDTGGNPNQTGWQQVSFNLESIDDPVLEIIFYSGNTDDDQNQSWLYIDNLTTAEARVGNSEVLSLSASDSNSGVASTEYSLNGITWSSGTTINASSLSSGSNTVYFRSTDNAGNTESAKTRTIIKNSTAPDTITDLLATATSKQTIDLDWTAPGDNGGIDQVSLYDIRYSDSEILDDTDFNAATKAPNPPAPSLPGEFENFTVTGLDSDTEYFFAIKSSDAVQNWSAVSNSPSDITLDQIADPWINYGDVVINELMWMGTSTSTADEFLELRNLTDQDIDMEGWVIEGAALAGGDLTLPAGSIIPAQGYFLITNFDPPTNPSSQLHDTNVASDWVTTSLTLVNTDAQYTLTDDTSFVLDTVDDGDGTPFAGDSSLYYSMERNSTPGEGTEASNWHTIFDDSAEVSNYWDNGSSAKGTPGGRNLSQAIAKTATDLELFVNATQTEAGFTLSHINKFDSLEYLLTYTSQSGQQAIQGQKEINNDQLTIENLTLGTCSSGGLCTYHQDIKKLELQVILKGLFERTLTKSLDL